MTPQEMLQRMVENIHGRTGRTWQEWVEVARGSGITTHKALTVHLKTEHGLKHNEAQFLAWEITDPGRLASYSRPKDLVDDLYSGKKAHLRPIHEAAKAAGLAVGDDVTPNVCRTYTSLATGRIFAMINPRTNSKVDLELSLPEDFDGGDARLESAKNSNPHFRHRVRLSDPAQVDDAVKTWLAVAAEAARK